jgi:rhomboid protease GluP
MLLLVSVVAIGALAWYMTEPWERAHVFRSVRTAFEVGVRRIWNLRRPPLPLQSVLLARTPFALVTPVLAVLQLGVFGGLLAGTASIAAPDTLLGWGASVGTKTANGEWWRLVTAPFVHDGVLQLAVNLFALISVGRVLERLVGPFALAATYFAAALIGGVVEVALSPVQVVTGAAGAIFGLYGLLIASWMWGALQQATTTIRLRTVARLTPAAAAFVLYHSSGTGVLGTSEQLAIGTGFIAGLVLSRGASEAWPSLRQAAATLAVTGCLVTAAAVPLRGISDVLPELERLEAMEERHTRTYDEAVALVNRGRAARSTLIPVIEATILPDLEHARTRLQTLTKVPPEQRPLLEGAEVFLRLRDEAWRSRIAAQRRSSMGALRDADQRERAALAVLRGLR